MVLGQIVGKMCDAQLRLGRNRQDLSKLVEVLKEESLKFGLKIENSTANFMMLHGKGDLPLTEKRKQK